MELLATYPGYTLDGLMALSFIQLSAMHQQIPHILKLQGADRGV